MEKREENCRLIWENHRYYDGGVSSVYFWDLDDGFAGAVLLKKSTCLAHRFALRYAY